MTSKRRAQEGQKMEQLEIYVHIPFCVRKCAYCDFYSGPASGAEESAYFLSLLSEIAAAGEKYHNIYEVCSVFIGGGTPSAVEAEFIFAVMREIRQSFSIRPDAEITMEANPGTLTGEKLEVYRNAGINRLSIGLQSTDNALLKKLGRIHTFEEFLTSYRLARAAGFSNISVDLMSGLPGQTEERLYETLEQVTDLRPEHISVYSLIIEEGTPFYTMYGEGSAGEKELPDDETDRRMYHETKRILAEKGYARYEISNYARPGFESRHNIGYWTGVPYLGFGAAAASFIGSRRYKHASARDYAVHTDVECEDLTESDLMSEYMILGLRMMRGVSRDEFRRRFGREMDQIFGGPVRHFTELGLLEETNDKKCLFLTERGIDLSNQVFMALLL